MTWTVSEIPAQTGRTVLVTGVSLGGIGHHTALELARAGARVVLAGRNPDRLAEAEDAVREQVASADLARLVVDLASLGSVRRAAEELAEPLDILVNNAGVMAPPYSATEDGFESQLATNHLGPFLLTGLLLPRVRAGGRVVTVSSQMHRLARSAPLGDPREQPRRYRRWPAYSRTKLANLLFTFELDRRLVAAGIEVTALAAHPGYAGTHLVANGRFGRPRGGVASILDAVNRRVAQSPAAGAWPTLMAATADLPGSTYCGPSGPGQAYGPPAVVGCTPLARDPETARRLWELSEAATGIRYP
ncbi:MAG TPA: oxidoreductase [Nocardioides sp.]|uniref:oxidoreductase n=1 Tax=Nocardioides sp. TaxID=35761 RepID=UPI002E343072|nr:oxidoreductase [Nocardioides sp.]HEX3931960.1 oxidoreductase [Nocardioides sp.]